MPRSRTRSTVSRWIAKSSIMDIIIKLHFEALPRYIRPVLDIQNQRNFSIQKFLQGNMQKKGERSMFGSNNTTSILNVPPRTDANPQQGGIECRANQNINRLKSPPANTSCKKKIRLVSPFKTANTANTPKESTTVPMFKRAGSSSKEKTRAYAQIQLGGIPQNISPSSCAMPKAGSNLERQASNQSFAPPSFKACNKQNRTIEPPAVPPPFSIRGVSPSKIRINNKSFDIGSLQSKVVFVAPLNHRTNAPGGQRQLNKVCSSQTASQQEDRVGNVKHSYEAEMREIKQLQQEIQHNNVKIKELLKGSNSRLTSVSRVSISHQQLPQVEIQSGNAQKCLNINPSMETRQTLINELNIPIARSESQRAQTSVQTDQHAVFLESSLERHDSKSPKFGIFRSNQCQVVVSWRAEVQPARLTEQSHYTFAQDIKSASRSVIKSPAEVQHIELSPEQTDRQEIIPVSQRPASPEAALPAYEVRVNLKSSRAGSEFSIIDDDSSVIQLHPSARTISAPQPHPIDPVGSTPIFSKVHTSPANPNNSEPQALKASSKPFQNPSAGVEGKVSGLAGVRRMNNSKYL